MGHQQTKQHRPGKHSYHQIGLVRGQFGNVPEEKWLDWIAATGFDGWEEASWELALDRCGDDAGRQKYAEERVAAARSTAWKSFRSPATCKGKSWGTSPRPRRCSLLAAKRSSVQPRGARRGTIRRALIRFMFRPRSAEIAHRQAQLPW